MEKLILHSIRLSTLPLAAALALAAPAFAGDVSLKLAAGTGFSIQDSTGANERLRVDEATGNVSRNGALFVHTTGTNNLFVGVGAGNTATTGSGGNTAVGGRALYSNSTGFSNSAFGDQALHSNTTGSHNSAVGSDALYFNTTGDRNLAFGQYAGQNQTTGSDNIYLANPGVAAESGRIRIGTNLTHTATFIAGISGSNVGAGALPVFVNTSGQLGTGGGSETPWTANMDANGFQLTGLGGIHLTPVAGATPGAWITGTQSETGLTWRIGFEPGGLNDFSGLVTDSKIVSGFNLNASGVPASPFAHSLGLVSESGYFNGSATNFGVWYESNNNAYRNRSTTVLTSKSVGFDLTVGEMVSVRAPMNGALRATGEVRSWDGTTVDIIWLAPVDTTETSQDPASGDEFETASTTTVTARTGTFSDSNIVWVYASGQPCGTDEAGAVAAFFNRSIANQTGATADLTMVQVRGLGTDLISGRCILQKTTGATATLGAVTKGDTALLGTLSHAYDAWRPGPVWNLDTTHQWVNYEVHTSPVAQAAGRAFRVSSTHGPNYVPYGMFNATWTASDDEADTMFRFGDDGTVPGPIPYNHLAVAFHGPIKLWRGSGPFNFHYLKPTAGAGNVNNLMPPVNGTLGAFTDLTGCSDGSVVLASGATGGMKCGAPPTGGVVAMGASVVADTASAANTGSAELGNRRLKAASGVRSLARSTAAANQTLLYEDADLGSNHERVIGVEAATDPTKHPARYVSRMSSAAPASAGARGPVIGAVSNGGTFDTPEELCDLTYASSAGVSQTCVAGSAKKFGTSVPADNTIALIGCSDPVDSGVYFEVVCNVE